MSAAVRVLSQRLPDPRSCRTREKLVQGARIHGYTKVERARIRRVTEETAGQDVPQALHPELPLRIVHERIQPQDGMPLEPNVDIHEVLRVRALGHGRELVGKDVPKAVDLEAIHSEPLAERGKRVPGELHLELPGAGTGKEEKPPIEDVLVRGFRVAARPDEGKERFERRRLRGEQIEVFRKTVADVESGEGRAPAQIVASGER
jgi:hypothetical protein